MIQLYDKSQEYYTNECFCVNNSRVYVITRYESAVVYGKTKEVEIWVEAGRRKAKGLPMACANHTNETNRDNSLSN